MLITPAADLACVSGSGVVEVPLAAGGTLLAAACDVYLTALAASGANPVTPLSGEEIASWRAVGGELLPRLWQHLRRRAGAGFVGPDPGEVQG